MLGTLCVIYAPSQGGCSPASVRMPLQARSGLCKTRNVSTASVGAAKEASCHAALDIVRAGTVASCRFGLRPCRAQILPLFSCRYNIWVIPRSLLANRRLGLPASLAWLTTQREVLQSSALLPISSGLVPFQYHTTVHTLKPDIAKQCCFNSCITCLSPASECTSSAPFFKWVLRFRVWVYCAESAESVSDGTDPNDVPGGTAPDSPVQLPEFTAVDQSGSDFSLAQLQVCFVHLQTISSIPIGTPCHRYHVAAVMTASN